MVQKVYECTQKSHNWYIKEFMVCPEDSIYPMELEHGVRVTLEVKLEPDHSTPKLPS